MPDNSSMPFSESLVITLAGILVAGMGMALWYFKSILLTSRCTEATCCCVHWKNKPLRESNLLQILNSEQPPTLPGQFQQQRVSGRLSEGHPDPTPSRPPSHDRQRPYRNASPDHHQHHPPSQGQPPTVIEMPERSSPASFSFKDRQKPPHEEDRTSYVISPLGLP